MNDLDFVSVCEALGQKRDGDLRAANPATARLVVDSDLQSRLSVRVGRICLRMLLTQDLLAPNGLREGHQFGQGGEPLPGRRLPVPCTDVTTEVIQTILTLQSRTLITVNALFEPP